MRNRSFPWACERLCGRLGLSDRLRGRRRRSEHSMANDVASHGEGAGPGLDQCRLARLGGEVTAAGGRVTRRWAASGTRPGRSGNEAMSCGMPESLGRGAVSNTLATTRLAAQPPPGRMGWSGSGREGGRDGVVRTDAWTGRVPLRMGQKTMSGPAGRPRHVRYLGISSADAPGVLTRSPRVSQVLP
jgi:hypothetical protein